MEKANENLCTCYENLIVIGKWNEKKNEIRERLRE